MANVALVSSDLTHPSHTYTKAVINGAGHVATSLDAETVTSAQLIPYDLIVTCRIDDGVNYNNAIVGAANAGVPVIIGYDRGGSNSGRPQRVLGLTISDWADGGVLVPSSATVSNLHPFFNGVVSYNKVPVAFNINPEDEYADSPLVTNLHNSVHIAPISASADPNRILAAYAFAGEDNAVGGVFPANMALVPWVYGRIDYTAQSKALLSNIMDAMLTPPKVISGKVIGTDGNPASKLVTVVYQDTGVIADKKMSDPITGDYEFRLLNGTYIVYVTDEIAAPLMHSGL